MYLALHLPELPLRAAVLDQSGLWDTPLALQEDTNLKARASSLTHLNPAARAFKLYPGITTARALARCPHLQILSSHPDNETDLRSQLLNLAQTLSPDLEITAPDTLIVTRHHPPAHARFQISNIPLQSALAPTPDLAHLQSLAPSGFKDTPFPILLQTFGHHFETVAQVRDLHDVLFSWGLKTIADFAVLPRADLYERLGPHAARLHDIINGQHHRLLQLHRPPKDYRPHLDLDFALETLASLLLLLRKLIHTLSARLQAHHRVPASLQLTLRFDNQTSHLSTLRIPEPTTDPGPLLRILETHF
ncbi:MAG: hypothetical protein AAF191_20505, partial [Verrucomicrobiota bacterium]